MNRDEEHLLKMLSVETLHVYNFILKQRFRNTGVTLEQLATGLKLTKPTILHHLNKLQSVDLVELDANSGTYKVKEVVKIAIVRSYAGILEKTLLARLPLIFILAILMVISCFVIQNLFFLSIVIALCSIGLAISFWQIKQIW